MRRRWSLSAPLLALALGGCSKPAPTASDFASLPADLVSAFCDWQARCCTASEVATASHGRYATADECRAAGLDHAVRDQLGLVAASIDEGRVGVRRELAEACIAAYRDSPCEGAAGATRTGTAPDLSVLIDCPGAFVGRAPLGRRCDTVVDCVAGAHCYLAPVTADGICVTDRQQGDPCAVDTDCAPGLVCRASDLTCAAAPTPDGGAGPTIPLCRVDTEGDGGTPTDGGDGGSPGDASPGDASPGDAGPGDGAADAGG